MERIHAVGKSILFGDRRQRAVLKRVSLLPAGEPHRAAGVLMNREFGR